MNRRSLENEFHMELFFIAYNSAPDQADILVQTSYYGDIYTQHIQGCGMEALHTVLDEGYLLTTELQGKFKMYM